MNKLNSPLSLIVCLSTGTMALAQSSPSLSRNLHEISNIKSFKKWVTLKPVHVDALRKNLFFTSPSDDKALYWAYGKNDYFQLPSIVTADNILQIYHTFFESTLRSAEEKALLPELQAMTREMLDQAIRTYKAQRGKPLEAAALKNVAYFGVADQLLGKPESLPEAAGGLVKKEIAKIGAAGGRGRSAIFPYDLDYSQFIVRGHYTRTSALGRYFKSMMWFGLAPFSVSKRTGKTVTAVPEQIEQTLLLVDDLKASGAESRWRRIYDATALFAGKSNNLTPIEWRGVAAKVFKGPSDYSNPALQRKFVASVSALRPPAISLKLKDGTNATDVQLRFMGQRAIPDSMILQRLADPDKRPFPSPLDVFAVLGNSQAKSILDSNPSVYNPKGWSGYLPERTKLEAEFANRPAADWNQDLYWSWMDGLRKLTAPPSPKYPKFMQSAAWAKKSLYSALGSWAELRHDTILYGMQSAVEMGDGEEPPVLKGYVEPNVDFYKRMLALMNQTSGGLRKRGFLSEEVAQDFLHADELIRFLLGVSQKELAGKKLTREEYDRIRFIEGVLEEAVVNIQETVTGHNALSEDDLDMALVADVHTAYGQALTVGVGRADHLFAVVPIEGKLTITRGTALSYYEFLVPSSARLTDEAWKKRLNHGKFPPRPSWVKSFHVAAKPKIKSD